MGVAVTSYKRCGLNDVGGAECETWAINICVAHGTSVHDRSLVRDNCYIPVNIAFTNDTVMGCHFLAICVKEILLWKDTVRSHLSTTGVGGEKWLDCLLHSVLTQSRPTHCPIQCLARILSPEQNDRDYKPTMYRYVLSKSGMRVVTPPLPLCL